MIRLGERPLDHFSFPSGHTLHAVMTTTVLGYIQPVLLMLMLPFTILVAVSRMILGLHYPSDVAVGAIDWSERGEQYYCVCSMVWLNVVKDISAPVLNMVIKNKNCFTADC